MTMPDLVEQRLDVALDDIEVAGYTSDDVRVVGGGTFGVIDESNWVVCDQEPAAGDLIGEVPPRVVVDRSCGPDEEVASAETETSEETSADPSVEDEQEADSGSPSTTPEPEPEPAYSVSEQNAIDSARSYLDYSSFSKKGLIEQLEFEGFSSKDAAFAVGELQVNYKKQAASSAESYMDYSSFSRSGLIEQLQFEGYTAKQARFGADSVGLN